MERKEAPKAHYESGKNVTDPLKRVEEGAEGEVDVSKLPADVRADLERAEHYRDTRVLGKGGAPLVDADKRAADEKVARASGLLAAFEEQERDADAKGKKSVTEKGAEDFMALRRQVEQASAEERAWETAKAQQEERAGEAGRIAGLSAKSVVPGGENLGIEGPALASADTGRVELAQKGAGEKPVLTPAQKRALAAKGQVEAEKGAEAEYVQKLEAVKNYLGVLAGPSGRLEAADDGKVFQAFVVTFGPAGAWEKFQKDYRTEMKSVAARGGRWDGKAIETFQRDWAQKNCFREDVYADIADLKARMGQGSSTTVEYAGRPGGQTKEKPFDILRYEMSRALGVKGPNPLPASALAELYSNGKDLPEALAVKGTKVSVDPESGALEISAKDGTLVASLARPSDEAVAAKLKELGRTK